MAERRVVPVTAEVVRPLRAAVLRPGRAPEESVYPGDDDQATLHLAAVVGGEVVGVATLLREPPPGERRQDAWRLRGMATGPEARGQGHGRALLRGCLDHVRASGGGLVWCNAREAATGFYRRHGFEPHGERFEIAGIGPHYRMLAAVGPKVSEPESERRLQP